MSNGDHHHKKAKKAGATSRAFSLSHRTRTKRVAKKAKKAKKPEKPIVSAKAWWRALDAGFARKDYRRVIELHDSGEESWRDLSSSVLHIFSLIATGEEGKAQRLERELGREHPASVDLHFLEGLALVPSGRTVEAAWCFARAARFEDVEVDETTASVAGKLGIEIRWTV